MVKTLVAAIQIFPKKIHCITLSPVIRWIGRITMRTHRLGVWYTEFDLC